MAQITLYHADGHTIQVWPVDVAELVRGGEYRLEPMPPTLPELPPTPPEEPVPTTGTIGRRR